MHHSISGHENYIWPFSDMIYSTSAIVAPASLPEDKSTSAARRPWPRMTPNIEYNESTFVGMLYHSCNAVCHCEELATAAI